MTSRSTLRPPPRRWWPARSIAASFIVALILTLGTGRAEAYPCSGPRPSRTLSVVAKEECPRPAPAPRQKRETDFASLAFFVGMLVLVLLVPVEYSRRRAGDPSSLTM